MVIKDNNNKENTFKDREISFHWFYENSVIPIVFLDHENIRIIDCNSAAASIFGYSSVDELIGKSPMDLCTHLQYDGTPSTIKAEYYIQIANTRGIAVFEWRNLRPDGTIWDAEVQLMKLVTDEKTYFQFTLRDITDRRQTDEKLIFLNRRLELIAKMTGDKVGSGTLNEVAQNLAVQVKECFEVEGCIIRLLEGDKLVLFAAEGIPEENLARSMPVFGLAEQILTTRRSYTVYDAQSDPATKRFFTNDPRVYYFHSYAGIPLILQDEIVGILGIYITRKKHKFTDEDLKHLEIVGNHVSVILYNERLFKRIQSQRDQLEMEISERKKAEEERKKLEDALIHSKKLESVGRLAGGVAHDFNNMLNVILGQADLIIDDIDSSSPVYESLKEIEAAARRSADLTRQLLAFASKQTIAPKVINFNNAIEGMLKMLTRLIGEDIEVEWIPGEDLWNVRMDPTQLDQILANLIVNSSDAITDNGKITIETDNFRFDEDYCNEHPGSVPGEYVMLAVSDNGCGMDQNTLENIFEPFFTTKKVGHGTGLGLATVYGIVKQNNGFINAYSEPEYGSTFKIYIARCIADQVSLAGDSSEKEKVGGNGELILLTEDEPMILESARKMLEKLGYKVITALTAGDALELAKKHCGEIALLITDVVMPEMNGRELSEKVHEFCPDCGTLFMSGYTSNVIAHKGILERGVHFMQKPFSMNVLARKVRDAIEGKVD